VRVTPRVRLHCVTSGDPCRPLVVLLHGFPEFWYGWRKQIQPLADAGFCVVAVDQRGYNHSSKPAAVADYDSARLVSDVAGLIRAMGRERAILIGHDWGGIVAWLTAMHRPDVVERLVILNAPHPAAYRRELRRGKQLLMSWYAVFFQLPWLPEALLRAGDFHTIRQLLRDDPAPGAFTPDDIEQSIDALRPRAALTGALNYYRAGFRSTGALFRRVGVIERPTLMLWGTRDRALSSALTEGLERWVPHLTVRRFNNATHWLHHERADEVNAQIIQFLTERS
jgi:epoxide hydrolase 4